MHSREQYLDTLRKEYRGASKKRKRRLLNEARKRTRLNRKVLIRKLAHPPKAASSKGAARGASYGAEVVTALVKVWEVLDYPCGQRLAPALREQVDRLRAAGELHCSEEVAGKLKQISPKTIDRLLSREKGVWRLRQDRNPSVHPLLYRKIPVKVASEWDTTQVGNVQVDYVEHCGRSTAGEYIHTLSTVDIASSWWEGEPISSAASRRPKKGWMRSGSARPSGFGRSIRTTIGGSSTIYCGDIAGKRGSRCRARGRTRRTTTPGWSKRTGRTCASWWATGDSTRRENWQ